PPPGPSAGPVAVPGPFAGPRADPGFFARPGAYPGRSASPGAEPEPFSTPEVANWPSFATDPSVAPSPGPHDLGPPPPWPGTHGMYAPAPPSRSPGYDPLQTGPAAGPGGDDYLPIFAAVESAWFDRDRSDVWSSPQADAGWSAAQAAASPVDDGATPSGLPKRVPRANLVPGAADSASTPKGVAPIARISPERVRNRLEGFQQGVRAARDDIGTGSAPPHRRRGTPPRQAP
ncbi:hypothetical protein GUY59_39190, partial [Nonomuraea sp. K271]|nr:hypothetical protein [Nonomuraea sp. K271]